MPRPSTAQTLWVWMNGERVGRWRVSGQRAQEFSYADEWIAARHARPISLSMPLGPAGTAYRGGVVEHFFENLLPDSRDIRERLRQRFSAPSSRAFDLLAEIGRDCIGAIQLTTEDAPPPDVRRIDGQALNEEGIARLLARTLSGPALGRSDAEDEDFRISLAGAQEKTALLRIGEQWLSPQGTTPTTHIFKLPIGEGPQGIDLKLSVENEWLCAQLLRAFGVPTADCWMDRFGDYRVLVVQRFDRRLSQDGRWIARIPQEDFCQATGTRREQKYEADGGPGIKRAMDLLLGSTMAEQDRLDFLRTQVLFWMLGAIDGHAKNFSLFLEPQGRFHLTPRYDVLSAYPVLGKKAGQLSPQKIRMAMAVHGERSRHYEWHLIQRRHWQATAKACGVAAQIDPMIDALLEKTPEAMAIVESRLPAGFPDSVAAPVLSGLREAAKQLAR